MAMKEFLVSALGAALELGIGTADDVLKHVTPDVLAQHLPRPLWARLITACLGAPKVNAQLVVDTIGIPNLCEHVPHPIMWSILSDIGLRSLGKSTGAVIAAVPAVSSKSQPAAVPASGPVAVPTAVPTPAPADGPRSRTPSRQPFGRPGIGSNAGAASRGPLAPSSAGGPRRPQAAAPADRTPAPNDRTPAPAPVPQPASALVGSRVTPPSPRRPSTNTDFDIDTDVRAESWKGKDVEVDDDQLIDWSSSEETVTGDQFDRKPPRS
jgi:hypothetical protein